MEASAVISAQRNTLDYARRDTCRVCSGTMSDVLDLGKQFLVRFPKTVDWDLPRAPIVLVACDACGLLQLRHVVNPDLLYREFHYRSGINQTMRDALQDVVDSGLEYHAKGTWLDIGANDGYLLMCLPTGWRKIACEPALNFTAQLYERADHVIPDYFTAEHEFLTDRGRGGCNVITSIAMFYDLDEPDRFVSDIAKALAPDGLWINQLNDSPTMLRENAFDSVVHEHLVYYDLPNLAKLYARHGMVITKVTFNEVNGGSARVFAHKQVAGVRPASLAGIPQPSTDEVCAFAYRTRRWKHHMQDILSSIKGDVWGYGASTKGSTMLQYLDMPHRFTAIADRNPLKHGTMMPGSWIPITSEERLRDVKPAHAFVMPWAFRDEFVARERDLRRAGTSLIFPLPNIEFVL